MDLSTISRWQTRGEKDRRIVPAVLRRRFGSVRARTTFAASIVVGSALLVGSIALVLILRGQLRQNVVTTARNEAANIASLVKSGEIPNPLPTPRGDLAAQVVDSSNKVVGFTANLAGKKPLYPIKEIRGQVIKIGGVGGVRGLSGQGLDPDQSELLLAQLVKFGQPGKPQLDSTFSSMVSADQSGGLSQVIQLGGSSVSSGAAKGGSGEYFVFVLASLASVDQSVATLTLILLLGSPLLLAIVALSTWILTKRAFNPVDQIQSDVSEISESNMHLRVFEPEGADEISRLAATMNMMLERLERSSEDRKRFIADASHELKSPLSAIHTTLEIALLRPELVDWAETATNALSESQRMQRIIDDLLILAKGDSGRLITNFRSVDLDELVLDEVRRLRLLSPVSIELGELSAGRVLGDHEQLRSVVRNLLENAVRHASTTVTVVLHQIKDAIIFEVLDDGKGISSEELENIFDRFTRLDEARSRDMGGSGLGLAIVKSMVGAHGGKVFATANTRQGWGARFVVSLPAESQEEEVSLNVPHTLSPYHDSSM